VATSIDLSVGIGVDRVIDASMWTLDGRLAAE
jgi:hypothetical protein